MPTRSAKLNLSLGAALISFSGVWVKLADTAPQTSAFYRVFLGGFFLLFFLLCAKEKITLTKSTLSIGLFCGFLFALDLICWHTSILLVGPGLATILGNFQVFILAAAGILFFQEKIDWRLLLSLPLAILGLFLIIDSQKFHGETGYALGIFFGLATALFYATYLLSLRHLSRKAKSLYSPMAIVTFSTAGVIAISMAYSKVSFSIPDTQALLSLLCLGLFSQCLGWLIIARSLPDTKPSTAGLILLLQPALAFLWDVLFFARPTTISHWLGLGITLLAIYLGLRTKQ